MTGRGRRDRASGICAAFVLQSKIEVEAVYVGDHPVHFTSQVGEGMG